MRAGEVDRRRKPSRQVSGETIGGGYIEPDTAKHAKQHHALRFGTPGAHRRCRVMGAGAQATFDQGLDVPMLSGGAPSSLSPPAEARLWGTPGRGIRMSSVTVGADVGDSQLWWCGLSSTLI